MYCNYYITDYGDKDEEKYQVFCDCIFYDHIVYN